jgi:hypothetical protein
MAAINGDTSNETLTGSAGDDTVSGGGGTNRFSLDVLPEQAVLSYQSDGSWLVVSSQGSDTLRGIHEIVFANDIVLRLGGDSARVDTSTTSSKWAVDAVALPDGGHVVVWNAAGVNGTDVYVRKFDADGLPVGAETLVNTVTEGAQDRPSVAALIDGGYVVAWRTGTTGNIAVQRFDADGAPVGGEVSAGTSNNVGDRVGVAGLQGGGFVVTWASGSGVDLFAQRFDGAGTAQGTAVVVNTYTTNNQWMPAVTSLEGGGYVISWLSADQASGSDAHYFQRFDATGTPVGLETQIGIADLTVGPSMSALEGGGFVAVWISTGGTSSYGVYLQRYDAVGAPVGSASRVNEELGFSSATTVTSLAGGGFVVGWVVSVDNVISAHAQIYDASGLAQGDPVVILDDGTFPSGLAFDRWGDGFIATWTLDSTSVRSRTFDADGVATSPSADIQGSASGEAIQGGGNQALEILAGGGDDTLTGSSANDVLDGQDGIDTVRVSDALTAITYTLADGALSIAGAASGTDALRSIEVLSDGSSTIDIQLPDEVTQVNTYTTGWQRLPTTATLADGRLLIVWQDDQSPSRPVGRLYDAAGESTGGEFTLGGAIGTDSKTSPEIAALSGGAYVVTWNTSADIYMQVVQADGAASAAVRVNTTTSDMQYLHHVAALADGGYLVTWTSNLQDSSGTGVYMQRYNSQGVAQGSEARVNTTVANSQYASTAAGLEGGGFVVTWQSPDASSNGIYMQRYDAGGVKLGGETAVNTTTSNEQKEPVVAGLADGSYVIAWVSRNQDFSQEGVYFRRFNSDGSSAGAETLVNWGTSGPQQDVSIVALADGGFAVSYSSYDGSSTRELFVRRFTDDGVSVGPPISVASGSELEFDVSPIAALANGGFAITWVAGDTGDKDVFVQRYDAHGIAENRLTLTGSEADDVLRMASADAAVELVGDAGADILKGGAYGDLYTGGTGNDTFEIAFSSKGVDHISDFQAGDTIALTLPGLALTGTVVAGNGTAMAAGSVHVEALGDSTLVHVRGSGTGTASLQFTLAGTWTAEQLEASGTTIVVAVPNADPTGTVTITGDALEGETLTATNDLADGDGLGTLTWQWRADGVDIEGAAGETLLLTQELVGAVITVVASYTDLGGTAESVESDPTAAVENVNDDPTGEVTITGTPLEGETLTASHTLSDADGMGTVSWQWQADGVDIEGADGDTLVLTEDLVGADITVVASYTDGYEASEAVSSEGTGPVEALNAEPTGDVTIEGNAVQHQTLTAVSTLEDDDGLGTLTWQWRADGVDIEGADGETLLLTQDLVGAVITVVASYTDLGGTAESVESGPTPEVENANDDPAGTVAISGTAAEGQTLGIVNTLDDADGMGTVRYQWQADGVDIDGADGETLLLTQDHVEATITVVAVYTDGFGQEETVVSVATASVQNRNDDPTGSVTVTGTPEQGQTLTASHALDDEDGLGTVSWQWLADGVEIDGAVGDTLVLGQDHVDAAITVQARYTDAYGTEESVESDATDAVANVNDAPTAEDGELVILEDAQHVLTLADFGFADIDGDTLATVTIDSLPDAGSLSLNGDAVTLGQVVSAEDIEAGLLVYAPDSDEHGDMYTSFGFRVGDGVAASAAAYQLAVQVTSVNDAPTAADNALGVAWNATRSFTAADFGFNDSDGNALAALVIETLPATGTLRLGGVAVGAGQEIAAASIGSLSFTPAAVNATATASFTFSVRDNGGTLDGGQDASGVFTLTLNVTPTSVSRTGTGGNDVVEGAGGDDRLDAGFGNDVVRGGAGDDVLLGNRGNDVLIGGEGNDLLFGGVNIDQFVFDSLIGHDTIADFGDGDKIVLSRAGLGPIGDGDLVIEGVPSRPERGFTNQAELVVLVSSALPGSLEEAAAAIGSATSPYGQGYSAIFVVRSAAGSNVYLFDATDGDAAVSATELTLIAVAENRALQAGDFIFSA